jgi:hypothetical protein
MLLLKKQPSKTVYQLGEKLEASDGVITAVYSNGTTQDVQILNSMVTNFSSEKGGTYALAVSYLGKFVTYHIDVVKKETGIKFIRKPKTEYLTGEDFFSDTAVLQLSYNDQSYDEILLTDDMVSGFNSDTTGNYNIEINYKTWTLPLEITVLKMPIISAEIYQIPEKTKYYPWENLDISGGKIHIMYKDSTEDVLDITEQMISGFDTSTPGKQTVYVNYSWIKLGYEVEIVQPETPIKTADIEPIKIFSYGNTIRLENINGKVDVYNISGRKVFSGVDVNEIFIRKTGIYIVKTGKITKKVFIK